LKEEARRTGMVTTILGRRRPIPEITSPNGMLRSQAENMAVNTPIQGSAADLIKVAMIRVAEALRSRKLASRLVLQVHDELLLDVAKRELDEVTHLVRDGMENAFSLDVPLKVDVGTGANWLEAH
jgi:DNA polymerase-1